MTEIYVECECGARIKGISINHANSLLRAHQMSKRHKELMEITKRRNKK